ncbi:MAG: hypothetical protein FWD02_01565 [Bacteroidales bacterium]|nr:hypothetical protein [Bacteroidales bacterium]
MKLNQTSKDITIRYIDPDGYFERVKSPNFHFEFPISLGIHDNIDEQKGRHFLYVKIANGFFEKRVFAGIFTDFSDENGHEIYTGDIVQFGETRCGISYNNNNFYLIGKGFSLSLSQAQKEGKKLYIVGNLFHSSAPQLLEESISGLCRLYADSPSTLDIGCTELIETKSPKFRQIQYACNLDGFKQFSTEKGVENPWLHVVGLAKKSGHYYDKNQTYATQEDLPILQEYNENVGQEHKFILDVLPCPFEGDIFNAKIIILTLNPGFSEDHNHKLYNELNLENQKRITDYHIENLELRGTAVHSDDVTDDLAGNYYTSKTKIIREEYGFQMSDFAVVQEIAYQSQGLPNPRPKKLKLDKIKSAEFTRLLVRFIAKYRTDDYVFIIARNETYWKPLLQAIYSDEGRFKKHVTKTNSYGNITLTKGNIENFEIIERIAPIKPNAND